MFIDEFSSAEMTCIIENIFEDGKWAIPEWKDPLGLRGCGFLRSKRARYPFKEVIGINFHYFDYSSYPCRQNNY